MRLLIAMVVAIVVLGFLLGVVEVLLNIGTTELPAI